MINRINNITGLSLAYESEIFLSYLPINTVQYILKDTEDKKFLLLISYDKLQDFFLDKEKELLDGDRDILVSSLVWYGVVLGHRCSLYYYDTKTSHKKLFGMFEYCSSVRLTEKQLLESFPTEYQNLVSKMDCFQKCVKDFEQYKYISKITKKVVKEINEDRKFSVRCSQFESSNYDKHGFALNNFAQIYPESQKYTLFIDNKFESYRLSFVINGDAVFLGTWMNDIGREAFLSGLKYIFAHFKNIQLVEYKNILYQPFFHGDWRHNDWFVPLPDTVEELRCTLSKKGRYNIKREKRIIEETFGGLELVNIPFEKAEQNLINLFYKFKSQTHEITDEKYDITKTHITDIYLLKVGTGDIKGMAISCEQGKCVYIENHTFDSSMRQYSLGQVLYDMYLEEMVHKNKNCVALAGGNLEYKKRYGSVCTIARSGKIKRISALWMRICNHLHIDIRSHLYLAVEARIYNYTRSDRRMF